MEPSGRTTAWLRDERGGWFNAGQVKYAEGLDRANYHFADVNGKLILHLSPSEYPSFIITSVSLQQATEGPI